ncbi:hypothetical protein BG015_007600 [Linnemannia schmuckeri]|uniref:Uncharacterized protein n=1 Tax=Linnemannia schmuckeri TaxID=64567 RepID=A0A9P5S6Q3_9FUNG|nr:hypothetical protein BG015_007600 [Linnemannia schmuckeri]
MQPHPLDIPEILAVIGAFLPLWVDPTPCLNPKRPTDTGSLLFRPKILLSCLLVSKLWHKTLLPVLWYSYRSDSMDKVPDAVIGRYSHHFRILSICQWSQWSYRCFDLSYFECTKLVELDIYLDEGSDRSVEQDADTDVGEKHAGTGTFSETSTRRRGGTGIGKEDESRIVAPLPDAKRLLRTNPRLKCLSWTGPVRSTTALDVEDLIGLPGLASLSLDRWDCSDGRLDMVLKVVAGSLKVLCVGSICGVESGLSSAPLSPLLSATASLSPLPTTTTTSLQLLQGKSCNGVDTRRSDTTYEWTLPRLERLVWSGGELDDEYLSELVKRCPKLKDVTFYVDHGGWDFDRLAARLGGYCPNIESLEVDPVIETHEAEALIRNCSPRRPQLRRLRIAVNGPNELGLVSAILPHASTLENFEIYRTQDEMNGPLYLRLLVACSRLTRFAFFSKAAPFDADVLETLKQDSWGCRDTLRELRLDLGYFHKYRKQTRTEKLETVELLSKVGGWEEARIEEGDVNSNDDEYEIEPFDMTKLRQVLELVQMQELKRLEVLSLDEVEFWRVRPIS